MGKPVTLYRYFDAEDVLLYVGITQQGIRRSFQHYGSSVWWPLVARATFKQYATMAEALEAERNAIYLENPRYNISIANYRRMSGHSIMLRFVAYAQGRSTLTAGQLAAILGMKPATARRLASDCRFPTVKVGRRTVYPIDGICGQMRLLSGQMRATPPFGKPCIDPKDVQRATELGLVEAFGAAA